MQKAFENRGLKPHVVLSAQDSDVIKTYVELGLGVGILAKMAFDAKRDRELRAIDASHLFESSTTRLGIKRGAYLRRYAYEFIELFAPQLPRTIVERAVVGAEGSRYELIGAYAVRIDEVACTPREDHLAPAAAGEDAVVADARGEEVLAPLARDVEAQRVRGLGLAVARDVVQLALDGQQRGVADRLRAHQLLAHEHAALGQREVLEHRLHRVEVVLGRHVEHGVVLVVEAPVRLGGVAVALHAAGGSSPSARQVAVGIHRHEAQVLQEARDRRGACSPGTSAARAG